MPITEIAPEFAIEPFEGGEWIQAKDSTAIWAAPDVLITESCGARVLALRDEIQHAKRIIGSARDWVEDDSTGYSEVTFDRAVEFLTAHLKMIWETYGIPVPIPRIGPGPEGSIDLHWRQPSWELLVNIPADANTMAAFYGDNYGTQKIRGSLDPRISNLGIATWLMN